MEIKDSEQIRKRLEEEYSENCLKIDDLNEKIKVLEFLERLRKSKTQKERIEESTKYEIEKEKLKSANKILKKIYDDLSENENLINSLSTSYNINEKDVDERTKEEIDDSIKDIKNILKKKQQEVDIATTKRFLKEKFWKVRDKYQKIFNILMFGMVGGAIFMFFYDMPIMYLNQLENMQSQVSLLEALAPAIIGGLACGGYCIKRINDYTSVFKTINNELGDNAISEFRDNEKEKQFDKDLENVIRDTCAIKLQLEEEKQKQKNIIIYDSEEFINDFMKKIINNDFEDDKESTIEEELDIDDKFIDVKVESFEELLNSPITKEQTLAKKLTLSNDRK